MFKDPIVEEVRRIRQEHSARYGHDIHRICEALRKRERESGRLLVNFGPRKLSDRKRPCVAEEPDDEYKTNGE